MSTLTNLAVLGPVIKKSVVTTYAVSGVMAMTAAQILGGLILRDPGGAARADTLPTAALIIAALKEANDQVNIGDSFEFIIRNTSSGSWTITVTIATGLTLSGTMTILQNNSKRFLAVVTALTTVTVYSLGTVVH